MKQQLLILLALLCPWLLQAQAKLDYSGFTLVWEDDFSYSSKAALMAAYDLDGPRCDQNTIYSWNEVNLDFTNDHLVLTSTPFSSPQNDPQCTGPQTTKGYRGGGIVSTQDHYPANPCNWVDGFHHGLYEIRAKLPPQSGAWPAFWTFNGAEELDIFEFEGDKPHELTTNFHDYCNGADVPASAGFQTYQTCPNAQWGDTTRQSCQRRHHFTRNLTNDWHTYSMVWNDDQVTFFIDGRELRTETRMVFFGCSTPFILNLGATGNANYNYSEFLVDYVKVYAQSAPNSDFMYDYTPGLITWTPDIYNQPKSMDVGEGNQVFYRSTSNWVEHYYWDGTWKNGPLPNTSNLYQCGGDIVVGENNQTFYRGTDGRIQNFYYNSSGWHHGWIDDFWSTSAYKISSACGALALGKDNDLFYRGTDNYMHRFYWDGDWKHEYLPRSSSTWKVAGDIVVGANNQVFYRGNDGRMQNYYHNSSGWHHDWVDNNWSTSAYKVNGACGSIAIGDGDQLFYRGPHSQMHTFYWNAGWNHAWLPYELSDQKVAGDISVGVDNDVFYRGQDGEMQLYYFNWGYWYHNWVNEASSVSSYEKVSGGGTIEVGTDGGVSQIFYRNNYGDLRNYYRQSSSGEQVDLTCGYNQPPTYLEKQAAGATENKSLEARIQVWPNPAKDQVRIAFEGIQAPFSVALTNSMGQIVQQVSCEECAEMELSLQGLAQGVYFVRVIAGEKVFLKKLLKQ